MKEIRQRKLLAALLCLVATASAAQSAPAASAKDALHAAMTAMGGEEALRGIHTVVLTATVQRYAVEQSLRPEGPYLVESDQVKESRDFAGLRWKRTTDAQFAYYRFSSTAIVASGVAAQLNGNAVAPGRAQDLEEADDVFHVSPERILLTALDAPDARRVADTLLHGAAHQVIAFSWEGHPARIFINTSNHLPSAVEWTRPYPGNMYWNSWGDVTMRVEYSLWWLTAGGVRYPLQQDVTLNGLPERKITLTQLRINDALADAAPAIPQDFQATAGSKPPLLPDDRALAIQNAQEIAPGITFIPGLWNVTIVKQADGIVILEAPIAAGYSAKVIAEAQKRYPGTPLKAVISTSDSWPHIGGVREYAAHSVPIYVLDLTRPLLERLLAAPHRQRPDLLQKSPRAGKLLSVSGNTVIGTGDNRIEIYPLRGANSERQMMVYFPGRKLLYGSDAFQQADESYTDPQAVSELRDAVARERLEVETFFMMHIPPAPWKELLEVKGRPVPAS